MYQSAVGTAEIVIATSTSYEFGQYNDECGKWNIPHTINPTEPYWVYNSGTPTLVNLERDFPTWKHVFLPVTAQCYAWLQGLPENATPAVNISTLLSGMTSPLTIRIEELEGGHPDNAQGMDCYCIGLTSNAERGKSFLVEAEFVYGALQDINDYVNLTTPPLAAGLMTGAYNGNPILEWNSISIPGIKKAVWIESKEREIVSSGGGATQTVHTYRTMPVKIMLWGGIEVDDIWDDYKARYIRNMTIQVKKFDNTSNIVFTFTNCRITSFERIGKRYEGKYASVIKLEAEKVTEVADWFTEGGVTFADHWRAAL